MCDGRSIPYERLVVKSQKFGVSKKKKIKNNNIINYYHKWVANYTLLGGR